MVCIIVIWEITAIKAKNIGHLCKVIVKTNKCTVGVHTCLKQKGVEKG